ncbi:hypothetical protein COV16_03810 [Candidatus Woesearchaeota archaeon CG10_big_fil_rev_8_21_14_0_10_34_8]|nr:MAG: hypothetical protein COV16_03810 [Candidatus Woesearchaeota archaeon CG10_big_fil_rev_8_21_14_0_10_34_8]
MATALMQWPITLINIKMIQINIIKSPYSKLLCIIFISRYLFHLLMRKKDLYFLLYLAEKTRLHKAINTSTGKIASDLDISQQTVSRKLAEFAELGLIKRNVKPSGVDIQVSSAGKKQLHKLYEDLHGMFSVSLKGIVKQGLGEGRFYMLQDNYKKQFHSKLGFTPFAGTLNLLVDPHVLESFLATKDVLSINGFETNQRSFGGLKCYKVAVNNITCGLIIPDRTVHDNNVVEIIASVYLREELKLDNESEVDIQ